MRSKQGFSLLEVLIAIVLLAVVVAVCVPYLKPTYAGSAVGDLSEFHARVSESLARELQSSSVRMSLEQLTEWARSNDWAIEQVVDQRQSDTQTDAAGSWVRVSEGSSHSLLWVSPSNETVP